MEAVFVFRGGDAAVVFPFFPLHALTFTLEFRIFVTMDTYTGGEP
jgi:hypothetical protein